MSEAAGLLVQETLQRLKKECGGLQTLLKNNHQVFRGSRTHLLIVRSRTKGDVRRDNVVVSSLSVEGGRVYIRDWRDRQSSGADARRRPVVPGALKTRPCWFYDHHPQRCPLQAEHCAFAHGPDDLRPSTRPLKKMRKDAC